MNNRRIAGPRSTNLETIRAHALSNLPEDRHIMAEPEKCAHPACNCMATGDGGYCSQYCHDAGDTLELACNCGHPGCAEEMAHRG